MGTGRPSYLLKRRPARRAARGPAGPLPT